MKKDSAGTVFFVCDMVTESVEKTVYTKTIKQNKEVFL